MTSTCPQVALQWESWTPDSHSRSVNHFNILFRTQLENIPMLMDIQPSLEAFSIWVLKNKQV